MGQQEACTGWHGPVLAGVPKLDKMKNRGLTPINVSAAGDTPRDYSAGLAPNPPRASSPRPAPSTTRVLSQSVSMPVHPVTGQYANRL